MPASIKLTVYRGEAKTYRFTLLDKSTREGIDLTGKTVRFHVREDIDTGGSPAIEKESGSGITHADQGTNPGEFDLALVAADTGAPANLEITEYVWDLWLDDEVIVEPSPFELALSVRGL